MPWWKSGVIYQIYPRSFADSNADGIGDLQGVLDRIDYLHDLGVDAIWLSPITVSPNADWGYDVADYCAVDPDLGTLEVFDALLEAAHARRIRVLLDFVPNHTSDQHPWFVESRSSRSAPRRDWYVWADPRADGSPAEQLGQRLRRPGLDARRPTRRSTTSTITSSSSPISTGGTTTFATRSTTSSGSGSTAASTASASTCATS